MELLLRIREFLLKRITFSTIFTVATVQKTDKPGRWKDELQDQPDSWQLTVSVPSVPKSLVFIRAYSYIRVFEEKYSYFARIFVIYSYFCELGHILRVVSCSIQLNHMATILQSWNNKKTCCWILNCIGVCAFLKQKQCLFTHFCRKNVASQIYALF